MPLAGERTKELTPIEILIAVTLKIHNAVEREANLMTREPRGVGGPRGDAGVSQHGTSLGWRMECVANMCNTYKSHDILTCELSKAF